jgi:F-type H+-transporting ATPase subunit b
MNLVTPDFGLLFWQILTFLCVLIVLSKFAWKPIISGLKEREESIEYALSEAKKARDEMSSLKADNHKLLSEARLERDKMLADAQHAASVIMQEAKEKTGKEAAVLIQAAREEIQTSKEAALAELKNYLADTSLHIAEKVIKKNLSGDAAQKDLIKDLISQTAGSN